jgi:hypothetical protein
MRKYLNSLRASFLLLLAFRSALRRWLWLLAEFNSAMPQVASLPFSQGFERLRLMTSFAEIMLFAF